MTEIMSMVLLSHKASFLLDITQSKTCYSCVCARAEVAHISGR